MDNEFEFQAIFDDTVRDITKRLAGIDLEKSQWLHNEDKETVSLYTATTGSYKITVVYHAEARLLHFIAEKMKRQPIEKSEEVEMYAKEYFNILCGHIISKINRLTKTSARFGIPKFCHGIYSVDGYPENIMEVAYQSIAGGLQLQSNYKETEINL